MGNITRETLIEEWKKFLRIIYSNVLGMKSSIDKDIEDSYKQDKPFSHRRMLMNKEKWCKKELEKLVKASKITYFELEDSDLDYIRCKGYENFFRCSGIAGMIDSE